MIASSLVGELLPAHGMCGTLGHSACPDGDSCSLHREGDRACSAFVRHIALQDRVRREGSCVDSSPGGVRDSRTVGASKSVHLCTSIGCDRRGRRPGLSALIGRGQVPMQLDALAPACRSHRFCRTPVGRERPSSASTGSCGDVRPSTRSVLRAGDVDRRRCVFDVRRRRVAPSAKACWERTPWHR